MAAPGACKLPRKGCRRAHASGLFLVLLCGGLSIPNPLVLGFAVAALLLGDVLHDSPYGVDLARCSGGVGPDLILPRIFVCWRLLEARALESHTSMRVTL